MLAKQVEREFFAQSGETSNQQTRLAWIDYAKALGILLVVYGHIARGLHASGITVVSEAFFNYADSIIYSFHMPLFFFLSGYFFLNTFNKLGAKKLVLTKIDTIFYPYLIWSVVQGAIEVYASQYTNGHTTLNDLFTLLWAPRAQFWFLYYLFLYFCLLAIIIKVFQCLNHKYLILVIFLISLVLFEIVLFTYRHSISPKILSSIFFGFFVYFMAGVLCSSQFNMQRLFNQKSLLFLGLLFIAGHYIYHVTYGFTYKTPTSIRPLLAMVSILFVIVLSYQLSRVKFNFLRQIGEASMPIFLMHIIILAGTRVAIQKKLGLDEWYIHLLVAFILSITIPMVIRHLSTNLRHSSKPNFLSYLFSAPISRTFIKVK